MLCPLAWLHFHGHEKRLFESGVYLGNLCLSSLQSYGPVVVTVFVFDLVTAMFSYK